MSKIVINASSVEEGLTRFSFGFTNAVKKGLEECGIVAEGYAKTNCPVGDTGRLRGSITHEVQGNSVYIGTNVEYGKYVEYGTGKYAEKGGRQTPWVYQDDSGLWHMTSGNHPQHFLRPALSDHIDKYKDIIKTELKNIQ